MSTSVFQDIKGSLRRLYLEDERPWLLGFSGGKSLRGAQRRDSTLLASLIFDVVLSIPRRAKKKARVGCLHRHACGNSRHS
jgi:hypothetical protein